MTNYYHNLIFGLHAAMDLTEVLDFPQRMALVRLFMVADYPIDDAISISVRPRDA